MPVPSTAVATKTVLVVDDDAMVLRLVQMAFELDGYKVLTACNGEEGLERARAERPDAILCDIMMPKLDGYAVTRALKGDSETAAIPIILVSAKTSDNDKNLGMAAGANDYVTKPFQVKALVARVGALMSATP
jgi:DNA-binding response OmpR family regulator